jgi:outer membrane lipase/esterase
MHFSKALLASSVFALAVSASTSAFAQRVVVFGDSLSDTGNAALATGNATPGSPLGRYSNGLNWVDLLYGPTAAALFTGQTAGNVDYALGGAFTGAIGPFGNVGTLSNPLFPNISIANEIALFAGNGGTFGAKDTVTLWGGANNFFFFSATTPPANINTTTIGASAVGAASSEISNAATLVAMGAKNLVVLNLPDLGSTPSALASGAAAVSAASFYSTTFNAALAAGLGSVAASAPGTNIIQADVASLFRVVIANASTFGFTNTTTFCGFNGGAACKGFVFADSVHPTEAAYALVAAYVGLLSNTAPALLQTSRLGETGLYVNEIVTNQVFDRMSAFISGTYADRNGPYAEIIGSFGSYDGSSGTPGLNMHLGGVRAGLDKKSGATLTGGSVTMLAGAVSTGSTKSDITSYRADVYSTALYGNAYISADAGISSVSLEGIVRQTGFPTVVANGSTGGYVASVAAEAGYVATMGAFTIIPSARLTYFHSKIDAYSETADILAMSYNDRETDAVLAGGKVRAVTPVSGFGRAATVFGEIGYEGFISTSTNKLTGQLVNNTALPTTVSAGNPTGPGVIGKVGMSSQISEGTFLDFHYGVSVHDGGGETHSGDIRLKATY